MIDLDELERLERYASLPPWDVDELRVLVNRPQEDCDDNFMQETDNSLFIAALRNAARELIMEARSVREARALERERCADALRCALEAMDYCIEDSAELLNERTAQWGNYHKDRQAEMAATLKRHRAVAERLRALVDEA